MSGRFKAKLHWPGWKHPGLSLLCGVVMAAGQAPLGLWPLTLAGLAALTWLVSQTASARAAGWIGLFAGAGYFAAALSWIVEPFLVEPEVYAWMIPFAVPALAFGLGLFWALAAMVAKLSRWPAAMFAVSLTATELARGWVFTGFPWALVGHVWIDSPVSQLAAFIGPNGLTLLTTALVVPPLLWRVRGLLLSALILGLAYGFGLWQLGRPDPAPRDAVVRLVQPNAEQHLKWLPELAMKHFKHLQELSYLPDRPQPDLIVWPETAVPYLLDEQNALLPAIADAGYGTPVATGIQRVDGTRGYNTLAVIGPDAKLRATYDKYHLVPFGEYIPFGDLAYRLFGLSAFAAQQGNGYSAGPGPRLLDLGPRLGDVLPLICYEAVFPQDIAAAPARPDWLLQVTNDAWFGTLTGPYQHLAQARLRAIEQGLPMLRAANTGVSAVIDARGRLLEQLPMGQSGLLDAQVPGALPATVYAKTGEIPLLVLLLGLCTGLLWRRGNGRA